MERVIFKHLEIKDGKMSLTFHLARKFIGSTVGGDYPPTKDFYDEFSCKPKQGQRGVLAFWDDFGKGEEILQFYWEGNKLIVNWDIECRTPYPVNKSKGYGFVVTVGRVFYVTKLPLDFGLSCGKNDKRIFKRVDVIDMLKYINGQYTFKELDKAACDAEIREDERVVLNAACVEIFNSRRLFEDILCRCWWLWPRLRERIKSRIDSLSRTEEALSKL